MATTYLNDVADSQYQGQSKSRGMGVRWIEFAEELYVRFGERNITDVIEESNKLKQEGTVTEYQEKFEELGVLMWSAQPTFTD